MSQLSTHTSPGEIAGIVIACVIFGGIALFLCDPHKVVPTEVMMQRHRERDERRAARRAQREQRRQMEQVNEVLPRYSARSRSIAFAPGTGADPRLPPPPPTAVLPPPSPPPPQPPVSVIPDHGAQSSTSSDTLAFDGVSKAPQITSPSGSRDTGGGDVGSEKEHDSDGLLDPKIPPSIKHQPSQMPSPSPARPPPIYSPSADSNV